MQIQLENISKSYGSNKVLDDINLTISSGGVTGLLGRNGAGKSTLLKIIAGVIDADQGSVKTSNNHSTVGYLSERNPLYPNMYIPEYLDWIAGVSDHNCSIEKKKKVIELVGLADVVGKQIKELSKGFRQRVGLAGAIVTEPDVLILDEPINGLDPAQIEEYRTVIKHLAEDKVVLLSSHLLQEINAVCDRVIMLENKKVSRDEIVADSKNISLALELEKNPSTELLSKLKELGKVTRLEKNLLKVQATTDVRAEIFDAVVDQNNRLLQLKVESKNFEKFFQS